MSELTDWLLSGVLMGSMCGMVFGVIALFQGMSILDIAILFFGAFFVGFAFNFCISGFFPFQRGALHG